jgi:hypothetical protein
VKLEYDLVEESFDDTTHIRTMTEQALMPNKGMLLRTTVYTPHHISVNVTYVPGTGIPEDAFEALLP